MAADRQNINLDPLKALVARVIRTFYDSREAIVADRLLAIPSITPIITDTDLAKYCRLTPKEVNRLCARLVRHRLIRTEARGETKKFDGKIIPKNYYVLDYKLFADVTRWKINKIDKRIRDNLTENIDNRGYVCPHCEKRYSMLDAVALQNSETGMFECEIDQTNLEEDKNPESVRVSEETLKRLSEQTQQIVRLLTQCDKVTLPAYNARLVEQELKADRKAATAAASATTSSANGGIVYSADTNSNNNEPIVEFSSYNEEQAWTQKQLELQTKREQNTLPVWHRISTVSGEVSTAIEKPEGTKGGINGALPAHKNSIGAAVIDEADADTDDYYKEYLSQLASANAQESSASMALYDDDDEMEFEDVKSAQTPERYHVPVSNYSHDMQSSGGGGENRVSSGDTSDPKRPWTADNENSGNANLDGYSGKRYRRHKEEDDDDDKDDEMMFEEVVPSRTTTSAS